MIKADRWKLPNICQEQDSNDLQNNLDTLSCNLAKLEVSKYHKYKQINNSVCFSDITVDKNFVKSPFPIHKFNPPIVRS